MPVLTDRGVKALKPKERPYKQFYGHGFYVWVKPNGTKYYKHTFYFDNIKEDFHIGSVNSVSLAHARAVHIENRTKISKGINPCIEKKQKKDERKEEIANSFESVATEFFENKFKLETDEATHKKIIPYFINDIFPTLGKKPINDLTANDFNKACMKIANRGARDSAQRTARMISRIYTHAVVLGVAKMNVAQGLSSTLPKPEKGNYKAITKPEEFGKLVAKIDNYDSPNIISHTCLKLLAYIFPRGGDLFPMRWSEVDLKERTWTYVVSKTKKQTKGKEFVCFLPKQAINLIKSLQPFTGATEFVFFSDKGSKGYISDTTVRKLLRTIGIEDHDLHGFRASMRTICEEELGFPSDQLEVALTHKQPSDKHKGAYARSEFLKQRRELADLWADYIDELKS